MRGAGGEAVEVLKDPHDMSELCVLACYCILLNIDSEMHEVQRMVREAASALPPDADGGQWGSDVGLYRHREEFSRHTLLLHQVRHRARAVTNAV